MARMFAAVLVAAAFALATVNSQYLGFPYATTATSFSLPFIGGFPYAPVAPVLKAAAVPYGAPAYPYYGAPFAHGVGPVVKSAYPFGPIVKTAVPALPVLKAPFAAPIGPYGPVVKGVFPAVAKAAFPFPAPVAVPAPVGPIPAPIGPVGPLPAPVI